MRIKAFFIICCLGCASASAQDLTLPERLVLPGAEPDQPGIRLWTEMDAQARAELWPYLDSVTRSVHWRDMSQHEREEMRAHLSPAENERIRRRYCISDEARPPRPLVPRLRDRDRSIMRQQIMEVHIELGPRGPRPGPEAGGRAHHKKVISLFRHDYLKCQRPIMKGYFCLVDSSPLIFLNLSNFFHHGPGRSFSD